MKKYDSKEALKYLREKYPDVEIKTDSFYHRIHRLKQSGKIEKVKIISKKEKRANKRGETYTGEVYRYYFTKEQLDAMKFRVPHLMISPVHIHDMSELFPLVEKFGKLVDMQGLIDALYEKYKVWYGEATIRNKQRRGGLLCVAIMGKNTPLYPLKQLDFIDFNPNRVVGKVAIKDNSTLSSEEMEKIRAWLDYAGAKTVS